MYLRSSKFEVMRGDIGMRRRRRRERKQGGWGVVRHYRGWGLGMIICRCCSVLQDVAVCCMMLQCAAGCCSVLNGVAECPDVYLR